MKNINKKKFQNCFIHAALGDVIGFNNGKYEFNNSNEFSKDIIGENFIEEGSFYSNNILFDFIYNYSFSNCPLPNMSISDDTIFHLCIANGIIDSSNENDIINNIIHHMTNEINSSEKITKMINIYGIGKITLESLKNINNGENWKNFQYNFYAGGTGGSMRSMCIGLLYPHINQRDKLIKLSLLSTRITHNNAIAWLGSITCAFFISLGLNNIDPNLWIFQLIPLLESDIIDNIVKELLPTDFNFYIKDKKIFIDKWKKYQQIRFDKFKFRDIKLMMFPNYRSKFYHEMFCFDHNHIYPGAGGDDSVIIAYDCLLDSKDSWDKLIIYSMLHVGDSDTTGTIAGAFYGVTYGSSPISKIMIKKFNLSKKLKKIGSKLYSSSLLFNSS